MFSALRISCLALLGAFILAVWYSLSTSIDTGLDQRYRQELRSLQVSDTSLNNDLLAARAGLVNHYDDLVRRIATLRQESRQVSKPPAFISGAGRAEIREGVRAYERVLSQEEELIESFKFDHAVLRNSLRFFPGQALALVDRISAHAEGQELAARVSSFYSDVLHYYLFSETSLIEKVESQRVALTTPAYPWLAPDEAKAIDLLTRHARVIMRRKPQVDRSISRLLDLPSAELVRKLSELYARHYDSAERSASRAYLLTWLLALASVLVVAAWIILRLRRSARDLSRASAELEQALASLGIEKEKHKELAELKSRFVSMTSHEFRTPLSVVLSSAELLQEYGGRWPEDKRQTHLLRVQNAAKYMKQMLDEVLLIGRVEAGKLEAHPQPVDLTEFCSDLVDTLRLQFKEHRVVYSADGELSSLLIDQQLIMHILDNLLSNAFKYSGPETTIYFDVTRDAGDIVFSVHDEGIGISEQDQERLFDTFHRGDNVGDAPGTGLGLAVVKRSVDVLQGSISVESTLGEGSTFVVRVPAPSADGQGLRDSA